MPAEWEPQSMVQLTWPHKDTDWAPMLSEITETYVTMAREITKREPLLIVVPSRSDLPQEVLHMSNVTIVECPTDDTWARDHGFIFLVEEPHPLTPLPKARGTLRGEGTNILLDFQFNGWGKKFEAENDNAINKHLWEQLWSRTDGAARADESVLSVCRVAPEEDRRSGSRVQYESHLDFVLEGGSIESDGKGTIFTTSCCLLAPNRNEARGTLRGEGNFERRGGSPKAGEKLVKSRELKEWIESELKRRLHAERIVWLDCEPMAGDDTDGHIDTMVRIAPNDTILYNSDETMRQQLEQLRTLDGKPYRLIELPIPEHIWSRVEGRESRDILCEGSRVEGRESRDILCEESRVEGRESRDILCEGSRVEQLPATYANFLILNGAVLVPTYAQPKNDAEAMRLIATAFPDREIIGIDSRSIIKQHGSIHCCTMQYY